jgi:predicted membrane protein
MLPDTEYQIFSPTKSPHSTGFLFAWAFCCCNACLRPLPLISIYFFIMGRHPNFDRFHKNCPNHRSGQMWFGVFILLVGVLLLLNRLGYNIPEWIFTWKVFLIALGLFIGIINRFRDGAWAILMIIGGAFLLNDLGVHITRYLLPGVFIVLGTLFIFSRAFKKRRMIRDHDDITILEMSSQDDFLDSTSIFGGYKKNVFSKNFKGGDLTAIFGGNEINLTNADFNGVARIDVVQIFGGTKLILPANWTVKTEMVSIFGGLDDKRGLATVEQTKEKVLIIDGVSIFGGIEIKNF